MSSDGYFDDDDLDFDALQQLENEALNASTKATHTTTAHPTLNQATPQAATSTSCSNSRIINNSYKKPLIPSDDSIDYFDDSFVIDEAENARLDAIAQDAYRRQTTTNGDNGGPRAFTRTSSKDLQQMTLFGDALQPQPRPSGSPSTNRNRPSGSGTGSGSRALSGAGGSRNVFGHQAPKTKVWDHTAYAKSGWKMPQDAKGKGKVMPHGNEEEEEEPVEFEQFPAPQIQVGPPPPMKLTPDMTEAKHWIYPLNRPKRDYQYNIVRHCLFDNTLVALPTGLGKTFIAGVVMLNYFRWFPYGKIIFSAPTKPLVAQQITACHEVCGIPRQDAVELTGNTPRATRARYWDLHRVFYVTPQTLINDLITENIDPGEIVLIVIDEAHRATGDYAYAQIIRYMMHKNPHFRVLALSATPGGTPEAVQAIVDSLHISRIEIRDEQSLDIRPYTHEKKTEQHIIQMDENVSKIQDLLSKWMGSILKPMVDDSLFPSYVDPVTLHPYRTQAKMGEIMASRSGANQRHMKYIQGLKLLGALARAMGYLLECSIKMCYRALLELGRDPEQEPGKKKKAPNKIKSDQNYVMLMREFERLKTREGEFQPHPKIEMLKTLVLQHFADSQNEEPEEDGSMETRAMVFAQYRDAVDEIVEELNKERPMIRAERFVGQGLDKAGKKGITQKDQIELLSRFKTGEFNILVSTSIGEEGLDIGDIDLIVCFDAQKTPGRMLQRVGRTGRKRDGHVHVLLAAIREEQNWSKAKNAYNDIQHAIVRGDQLELFADAERLLPAHIKPEPLEQVVEIQEYVPEPPSRRRSKANGDANDPSTTKKRRRNDDVARNIPAGASMGFVSVSDLLVKGGAKKRKKVKTVDPHAGDDDDLDEELEAGLSRPRRTQSEPSAESSLKATKGKGKSKIARSATMASGSAKGRGTKADKKKKKAEEVDYTNLTSSQLQRLGEDDSDDMELDMPLAKVLASAYAAEKVSVSRDNSPVRSESEASHVSQPDRPSKSPNLSRSEFTASHISQHDHPPNSPKYWSSSPKKPLVDLEKSVVDLSPSPELQPALDIAADVAQPENTYPAPKASVPPLARSSSIYWSPSPDVVEYELANAEMTPIKTSKMSPRSSNTNPPPHLPVATVTIPQDLPPSSPPPAADNEPNSSMAWLIDDDDDDHVNISISLVDSSPVVDRRADTSADWGREQQVPRDQPTSGSGFVRASEISRRSSPRKAFKPPSRVNNITTSGADHSIVEIDESPPSSAPLIRKRSSQSRSVFYPPSRPSLSQQDLPTPDNDSSSPIKKPRKKKPRNNDMPPPQVPAHAIQPSPRSSDVEFPEPSYPIGGKRRITKRSTAVATNISSPLSHDSTTVLRRLRRAGDDDEDDKETTTPSRPKRRKKMSKTERLELVKHNPWVEHEAEHSGSEISAGSSHEEDEDPESESDRMFLHDFPETQVSASYNQAAAYHAGLMTQVPSGVGLQFARSPVRKRLFKSTGNGRRPGVSSSPPRDDEDEVPDEYSLGSFVVADDEDISYYD